MDAWQQTVAAARQIPSSFYWPIRLMPQATREAMWVLYGFCHRIDAIADESPDPKLALIQLEAWKGWLESPPSDQSLAQAFAVLMERYDLPISFPLALIEASEMDLRGEMVRPSAEQLKRYCYGVASVVGLMTVRILGVEDDSADPYAIALGQAFQRTNILRDIEEDKARGRHYLPSEWAEDDWQSLGEEAESYYAEASVLYPSQYDKFLRPTRAMWWIYAALFERIKAANFTPRAGGYRLAKWQKIWYASQGYLRRA